MNRILLLLMLALCINISADVCLMEYGAYINGEVYTNSSDLPDNVSWTDDFWTTGIGTVSMSLQPSTPGDFSIACYFDHEINETENTFFNEYGTINGTPDSRLLYEIDEPGYSNGNYIGDIWDNFEAFEMYGLDGQVFYDSYTDTRLSDIEDPVDEDVAMAMGWNFSLNENESAFLTYTISNSVPASGFYLAHLDRDSPEIGIYLQSSLTISKNTPVGVPEPTTAAFIILGLVSLLLCYGNFKKKANA